MGLEVEVEADLAMDSTGPACTFVRAGSMWCNQGSTPATLAFRQGKSPPKSSPVELVHNIHPQYMFEVEDSTTCIQARMA